MPAPLYAPAHSISQICARVLNRSRSISRGVLLAAVFTGTGTAQEARFDAGRFSRETVASNLEEHVNQGLRFGFYEEALGAALEAAAAFDGRLAPVDQARLDETVARCLLINRADLEEAAERFGSAFRLREESAGHEPFQNDLSSLHDGMPSRVRLRGWEAECRLLLGDAAAAMKWLEPMAAETDRLFGDDLAAALARHEDEHAKQWNERDNEGIHALNDRVRIWSWVASLYNQSAGETRSFFDSPANREAMDQIILSPYLSTEYQKSLETDHVVGPHFLTHYLDAAADYLATLEDDSRSVGMAKRLLAALENDPLDRFNLQRARLLELILSRQTTPATAFEDAMIALLGRPSRLESEGVYLLALAAARARGDDHFFRDVVLKGKLKNSRYFARQKNTLGQADPGRSRGFQEAYQEWIESRIQLGMTHPKTIERWDTAMEMLNWETDGDTVPAAAVTPSLNPETVAIEWVRCPGGSAGNAAGDVYTALVVDHRGEALMIDLGDAESVDALAGSFDGLMTRLSNLGSHETDQRKTLGTKIESDLATLRRRLVEPILAASPSAKQADRWVMGCDGRLALIPFFALGNSESGVLGMEKILIHVNSIASWNGSPIRLNGRGVTGLLVGDPDYGASGSVTPPPPSTRTVASALAPNLAGPISRLKGTGDEVRALGKLLSSSGHRSTLLLEADASEENIRAQLSASNLLHIATHGFFFPPDQASYRSGITGPESLFFSAIILGGAEVAAQSALKGRYSESKNDGLMMAAEFYPLDLRHVDLVSLSACQTALGEPHPGEGIAGLSRGLAAAGVRNSLLTLWSISDVFTPVVMTRFLERALSGEDLHQAINDTQRELFADEVALSGLAMATYLIAPFRIESNTLVRPPSVFPRPVTTTPPPAPVPSGATSTKWIIACEAEKERSAAENHAETWRKRGLSAGVLWIPDFASLSGAKLWLTYVGPWPYRDGRENLLETLKTKVIPHYPDAFGIRIDQNANRETIR